MTTKKLANRKSVKNAVLGKLQNGYQKYFEENKGKESAIPITRTKLLRQKRLH